MPGIESAVAAVLDTHVWVWGAAGDRKAGTLKAFQGTPVLSAISVWEVAMLESKGRLTLKPDPATWIRTNLAAPIALEPLSPEIALESCRLAAFHGDPADRIIVATAAVLGLPLLTADAEIVKWNRRHKAVHLIEI
jgi:PIN domain nuclease of toxin-antitoxin system